MASLFPDLEPVVNTTKVVFLSVFDTLRTVFYSIEGFVGGKGVVSRLRERKISGEWHGPGRRFWTGVVFREGEMTKRDVLTRTLL